MSSKKNEDFTFNLLHHKRKEKNLKFEDSCLVGSAEKSKISSKNVTTNWSHKIYTKTKFVEYTMPTYRINRVAERYNEALLKNSTLTLEKSKLLKTLGITKGFTLRP